MMRSWHPSAQQDIGAGERPKRRSRLNVKDVGRVNALHPVRMLACFGADVMKHILQ